MCPITWVANASCWRLAIFHSNQSSTSACISCPFFFLFSFFPFSSLPLFFFLSLQKGLLLILLLSVSGFFSIARHHFSWLFCVLFREGAAAEWCSSLSLSPTPLTRLISLSFPSHSISLPPLLLSSPSSLCLLSRKPVNMNKTPITYRQEKSNMMGSMERSFTDQSTLQEDERMALSFMDTHTCSTRSKTKHQCTHLDLNWSLIAALKCKCVYLILSCLLNRNST